ncbi:MAG: hypothetical protein ACK55I_22270, partial [bacterium]
RWSWVGSAAASWLGIGDGKSRVGARTAPQHTDAATDGEDGWLCAEKLAHHAARTTVGECRPHPAHRQPRVAEIVTVLPVPRPPPPARHPRHRRAGPRSPRAAPCSPYGPSGGAPTRHAPCLRSPRSASGRREAACAARRAQ